MTVKLEQLTTKESATELAQYLASKMDDSYAIETNWLAAMAQGKLAHCFVKRSEGKITGAQVWLTIPNPVRGSERICCMLAMEGEHQEEIKAYRTAVFDTFAKPVEIYATS